MPYSRTYNPVAICNDTGIKRSIDGDVIVDLYEVKTDEHTRRTMYLSLGSVAYRRWAGQTVTRKPDPESAVFLPR